MTKSNALIPGLISRTENTLASNILSVILGVGLIAALAQIKIALPWTPVPITGQTFGVALMALSWGRVRGGLVMLTYLGLGAAGLPLFAGAQAGLTFGPTLGYLLGMGLAAYWMGFLADIGWTNSFLKTWAAAASGSLITFSFGCLVLSQFVGWEHVLVAGVLPFLPGDLVKGLAASSLVSTLKRKV